MSFALRVREVGDSVTLAISARAMAMRRAGVDVVNLSAGEPDFPTPPEVLRAASAFLAEGQIKYTATAGMPELRAAIAAEAGRRYGAAFGPDQVTVTCGGKHALYASLQVLCDVGDEVLFISPCWGSYPEMIKLAGGRPVAVETRAEDGFRLDLGALEAALGPRTRAIMINSPCNPTGIRLSAPAIEALTALAVERGIWILSDEIYDRLCYDGRPYQSPMMLGAAARARTVVAQSFSKTYSMTGWRVGYALGPAELIRTVARLQDHETSNVNTLAQVAALAAIQGDQGIVAERRAVFDARRRLIHGHIAAIPGWACPEPEGAFYVFPRVDGLYGRRTPEGRTIGGSSDLALALLEEARVAAVPGAAFGDDRHLRFSYATSEDQIVEGMRRVSAFVAALG